MTSRRSAKVVNIQMRRSFDAFRAPERLRRMRSSDLFRRLIASTNPGRFFSLGAWLPELRGIDDEGAVALTFDDGPSAATLSILDLLRSESAKATFFVSGVRAVERLDLVEAIVRNGHDVYGHGWDHVPFDGRNVPSMVDAVDRCERLLATIRPTPSPYFVRMPYTGGH